MLYDAQYDVACPDGIAGMLEDLFSCSLILIGWETTGNGGGNPTITARGTREAHTNWLIRFYDPHRMMIDGEGLTDDQVWRLYDELFGFMEVAACSAADGHLFTR